MAYVITIANEKGGVGKTSVSTSLAAGFTLSGFDVLLIDCDPQSNSTSTFNAATENEYTMYDVMEKACTLEQAIQHTPNGDIVPNDKALKGQEARYALMPGGYFILKKAIDAVRDKYDIIILDTPPNIGAFTISALAASDGILIPVTPSEYAMKGLTQVLSTVAEAKEGLNENLEILGAVLINCDKRKKLTFESRDELLALSKEYNFKIFDAMISTCQEVEKAQRDHCTIFEKAPRSSAALDYVEVIKEMMKLLEV